MNFLKHICKEYGVDIYGYKESKRMIETLKMDDFAKRCNGFCANVDGNKMIFCNENMEEAAFYHVLAHEMGHLLLGHLDSRKDMRPNQSNLNWQEIEANIFACILFAMDLWNTYSN